MYTISRGATVCVVLAFHMPSSGYDTLRLILTESEHAVVWYSLSTTTRSRSLMARNQVRYGLHLPRVLFQRALRMGCVDA